MVEIQECCLRGVPVSAGIAMGRLVILKEHKEIFFAPVAIEHADVDAEILRYRETLSSSRCDLQQLQKLMSVEGSTEAVTIIDTHIQMLEDPLMTTMVEQKIRQMLQNTESVFRSVMGEYEKHFLNMEDQVLRQRLIDVKDLSQRVLSHLHPQGEPSKSLSSEAVIFSKELTPSDTIEACVSKVKGFISERGGETSHAALIARAKGIPYVANIEIKELEPFSGCMVIVDGGSGLVIVHPSLETLAYYAEVQENVMYQHQKLMEDLYLEALTQEGKKIHILANIEKLEDFDHPFFRGAEGVGLCRSEFLFAQHEILTISEEEQYEHYIALLEKAGDLPIVFRVFDVGSDKGFFDEMMLEEANPALGCRAIRFLLRYPEVFKSQLRAILRASQRGYVSLLFPLIADISELRKVHHMMDAVKQELLASGIRLTRPVPIGCMIEVPSAVLSCKTLARECDFFSIGTNDLIQYTLAMDRGYSLLSETYKSLHPSILKMLKMVIDTGKQHQKKVSLCGEMASNPLYIKLLVGLGVESISCAPRYIPLIKKAIRSFSYAEAKRLAEQALALETSLEVEELIMRG